VENRLRIVADLSVNTLPAAPAKQEKLAKRMGYRPRPEVAAREQFLDDYAAQTARVRAIYNRVFGVNEARGLGG
jgi:glutamine synthetase adenylyltransferase